MAKRICQNCGALCVDGDFCEECGTKLITSKNGFFHKIDDKTSSSSLIYSFIVLGLFLFIGSVFFGIFTSNGSIGFSTHILLTVILAVFAGGIFLGYFSCLDNSYIIPNFIAYFGSIAAVILCGAGGFFTITSGFTSALSSVFSSSPLTSSYSSASSSSIGGSSSTNMASSIFSNFIVDIFILILLIPAASYLGIYVGYLIKNNLH